MRSLLLISLVSYSVFPAGAQTGGLSQPVLGYTYDPTRTAIRPIRGVPGAAFLGDAVEVDSLLSAAISPRQDIALAVSADDLQLHLIRPQSNGSQAIPGAISSPSQIVFSPSGQAAALIGEKIQVLTALDASPAIRDLPMPALSSTPATVAISDDGQTLLLSSGTQDTDPVWLLTANGAVQLPLPGSVAAAAFRRDSTDAVVVTRNGDVYIVRNANAAADVRQIYVGDGQTTGPVAVQFAADGARAVTVNSAGVVSAIDLQSGSTGSVSCRCTPTTLAPLNSTTLFRLTEISDRPVLLYDTSSPDPRVWFVPADGPAETVQRSSK